MPLNRDIHADQWTDITDFSPGAYSYDATIGPTDRALPAPLGAHDPYNSFSCIVLPGGGLGALPGVTATYTYPGAASSNGNTFVTGLLIHDELSGPNAGTEAIVIGEYDFDTTAPPFKRFMNAGSFILETLAYNLIVNTNPATTYSSPPGIFGSPYPQMTRMSASNPATAPFIPVVVWPSGGPAQASPAIGQVYVYPNVAGYPVTTYPPQSLITGAPNGISGQCLVHQGRVIILCATTYTWPGTSMLFNTNDNVDFTDPSNTTSLGNQQTIFAPEEPFGYGGGGSQSAGELFLIKKRGGAVVVTGDVSNPSVTILPGVESTGNFYGQAASTSIGMVYGSYHRGVWVWNGSNTAQKLSANLDDDFFLPPEFLGTGGAPNILSNNYGYYVHQYGDWIFVSNNWLYDIKTNSWWKYYPNSSNGGVNFFWTQIPDQNFIYCAVLSFPFSNKTFLYRFDPKIPAQTYQWTSMPLILSNEDRRIDVREVVVRASSSTTNGVITLTIADQGVTVFTQAMSGHVTAGPELIRWNVGATALRSPQIQLNVANTGAIDDMPVIHSIHIRWKQRAHEASTN